MRYLLVGFTRMGILHNVAVLTRGAGPDHADGSADDWVRVENFRDAGEREVEGAAVSGVTFDLMVDGEPSGTGTLWLAVSDGLPVRRDQVVLFPEGEMRVVETYSEIRVIPASP